MPSTGRKLAKLAHLASNCPAGDPEKLLRAILVYVNAVFEVGSPTRPPQSAPHPWHPHDAFYLLRVVCQVTGDPPEVVARDYFQDRSVGAAADRLLAPDKLAEAHAHLSNLLLRLPVERRRDYRMLLDAPCSESQTWDPSFIHELESSSFSKAALAECDPDMGTYYALTWLEKILTPVVEQMPGLHLYVHAPLRAIWVCERREPPEFSDVPTVVLFNQSGTGSYDGFTMYDYYDDEVEPADRQAEPPDANRVSILDDNIRLFASCVAHYEPADGSRVVRDLQLREARCGFPADPEQARTEIYRRHWSVIRAHEIGHIRMRPREREAQRTTKRFENGFHIQHLYSELNAELSAMQYLGEGLDPLTRRLWALSVNFGFPIDRDLPEDPGEFWPLNHYHLLVSRALLSEDPVTHLESLVEALGDHIERSPEEEIERWIRKECGEGQRVVLEALGIPAGRAF